MTTVTGRWSSVVISVTLLFTATAGGEQIYRWVGADGATHFSETPPDIDPAGVEILEVVPGVRPLSPSSADYQSVLDVAKAIESSRLERERLRLEKKKLLLQNRQLRQSAMIPQEYEDGYRGVRLYYPPYYRYPPRHPRRRHYYHRPVKPEPHSPRRHGHPGYGGHSGANARVDIRK